MIDDGALLKEYVSSGSEVDFARLVERHLDLVYATALRVVAGDVMLAQDAAQAVFMDLARKAGTLTQRTDLTGWLYRSACFAAAKLVRSERRRQVRELEAHRMQEQSSNPHLEPDWDGLRSILDDVMLELKEPDREALLLRYFRGCSLAEVGNKLGLNENAARMRVERALEKLRGFLASRGVHSTSAALGAALTQQTICAVPTGLAATITVASLAGVAPGAGLSAISIITMTHTKSILLGALVVAGAVTPLAIQHRNNARQATEIETLRQLLSESTRPERPSQAMVEAEELERLRAEHRELIRLRGEVASLRERLAETQPRAVSVTDHSPPSETSPVEPLADLEMAEFLSYPAWQQGNLLGNLRHHRSQQSGVAWTPTPEWERARKLAEKVRPELEALESRPADFAEFQSAYIQAAIGLEEPEKIGQIKSILQSTYEQAVAVQLDAGSRPAEEIEAWAQRRDALDRPATRAVQQLLTPGERESFDQLFLGVMGIDLGLGDGAWHRFVRDDGAVIFPSEDPSP